MNSMRVDSTIFGSNWKKFLMWGIALIVLGFAAVATSTLATIISIVFIGTIMFLAGLIIIFDSFSFWWGKWSGFALHVLMGILYAAMGAMLLYNPILGSISLTFLLGIFYLLIGMFRLGYSWSMKTPRWGCGIFNAILSLLIGVLILASWPSSSLFIIGLFVGIDLVFAGWTYIMAALAARPTLP